MTTLAHLATLGASVNQEYVKKQLTWDRTHLGEDDVELSVWVRQPTTADFEAGMAAKSGEKLATRLSRQVRLGADGPTEEMSIDFAGGLDPLLAAAMSRAIDELGAGEKKASKKTT